MEVEQNNRELQLLKKGFFGARLSHGLLFSGPEGVGKKKTALEFCQLVSCLDPQKEKGACGLCPSCKAFVKGNHPDSLFQAPSLATNSISIALAKEVVFQLSFKPFLSAFKTVIIDQAHLLQKPGQHCLLKVLEEPPAPSFLILITSHPELLLPTIRSRLLEFRFGPLDQKTTEGFLLKKGLSEKESKILASLSLGRLQKALSYLDDPQKIEKGKKATESLLMLLASDLQERFDQADQWSQLSLKGLFEDWLDHLRLTLFCKMGLIDNPTLSRSLIDSFSLGQIKKLIEEIETAYSISMSQNVNKRLLLETLALKF